jgi:murein DD-endopeptidase MepM/ murein hydrolase activator NlpD
MKRAFGFVLVAACGGAQPVVVAQKCPPAVTVASAPAVGVDGFWTGVLAGKLHITLTVRRGAYTGVLDSIDQGAKLPIENVTFEGDTLRFDIPMVKGSFAGKLDPVKEHIEGTWTQSGMPQPLAFDKGTAPPETKETAQKPLDSPVDVTVASAPIAFRADDHTRLAWELRVTNFAHRPITLSRLEVRAGTREIAKLEGDALAQASDSGARIPARATSTTFVWATADDPPATLEQRLTIQFGDDELTTTTPVSLRAMKVPVIGPPLRGRFWIAANGPSNDSAHRRALIPTAGHARIAQRFAIDWVQPGDDGKTHSGDASKNASYHAYGKDALAVADGTVVETKDGIAENVPGPTRAVPITLETIGGNHVVLDIGGGAFAFYAHLQPGSLKVKVGEHVKRGRVLGLVGNSGNSSEPHLHFHVMDSPSMLGSEGIPYAFDAFELKDGTKRTKQIPTEKETIAFP